MASAWDSMISGQAIGGAASGASLGGTVGGPWGAAIGGVLGGVGGAYMDYTKDKANTTNSNSMSQIMQNIAAMNKTSYAQHISDLNKSLAFYAVPQQQWNMLYGQGTGAAPAVGTSGAWAGTAVK
jgi:hypothetical protein